MNDSGEAAAAWTKGNAGSGDDMYVAIKPPGGSFGTPVTLSGPTLKSVDYPEVGVDAVGDVFAAWVEGDDNSVHFAEKPHGGEWGSDQTIAGPDTSVGALADSLQLAVSANGDSAVSWHSRQSAYVRIRNADGSWEPTQSMTEPDECWAIPVTVKADAKGDFLAVWPARAGSSCVYTIRYAWRAAGQSQFGATHELLSQNGTFGLGLGLSPDGHATMVFNYAVPGTEDDPFAASDAPLLGQFGPPVVMGPQAGGPGPSVSFDQNDDVYVGWWDWDNTIGGELAHAVMRPAGGSWGQPVAMTATPSSGLSIAGMRDSAIGSFEDPDGIQLRTGMPDSTPPPPNTIPLSGPGAPGAAPQAVSAQGVGGKPRLAAGSHSLSARMVVHVRAPKAGVLLARLIRHHRRYASVRRPVGRPGIVTVVFSKRGIPAGHYTLTLVLRQRHHMLHLPARKLTVRR